MAIDEPDEALYQRARKGDMEAFDALYERYERRLFGFILRMVRDRQDAEDLFHEAFLGVLESREVRFSQGSFCAWIHRVARNLCLNHLRAHRRDQGRRARLGQVPDPPAPTPEDGLDQAQDQSAVAHALLRLPPPLSEVYHLRTEGLSYEDMAAVLQVPVGTVKSRMNQLVRKLKEEIGAWSAPACKKI